MTEPKFLTMEYVAPSNYCNLRCNMCGPYNSSSLAKENQDIGLYNNYGMENFQDKSLIKETDNVEDYADILKNLVELKLVGGETLAIKENYDLILSNPPYISKVDYNRLDDNVKLYEPKVALFGGINGFKIINKVITKSNELLKVNGKLIIEIGDKQRSYAVLKLNENGFYINKICKDYSGKFRIIISTKLN